MSHSVNCTEVRFASFLSGGFTTMAVIDPPERKLAKRTSVYRVVLDCFYTREFGLDFSIHHF